eukprot:7895617-Pyramimonas_sp.AAC.1
MGGLRPEIPAIHEAQQANLAMQSARLRRNQERQANGMLSRAGQPAISNAAGTPAISPATLAVQQCSYRRFHRFDTMLVRPLWSVSR